jgi:hypothetical protein
MPFLCTPRVTSPGENVIPLQVTDLFPHKTQSNPTLTPVAKGPQYIYAHSRNVNETVATVVNGGGDIVTVAEYEGISAYILATLELTDDGAGGGGEAISAANANAIGTALVARMEAGLSITEADINAVIVAEVGANNGIGEGNSLTDASEVLNIVSGYKQFTLPAATVIDLGAVDFDEVGLAVVVPAAYADPADLASMYTEFSNTFYISARSGQIKKATTRTVNGVSAPLLVVYNDDGSLIN